MLLDREHYWRVPLTFNYEECMAAVTEDVRDEAHAQSMRYAGHEEAVERLAFRRGLLDKAQMHAYSALMVALSERESVVLDRLWAGGLAAALQSALVPGFSVEEFWREHLSGWRTKVCEKAMAAEAEAYEAVKTEIPETLHERLAAYRAEKLRGTRLLAETTAQHGFEFGGEVLEQLGRTLSDADVTTFYNLFPNEMRHRAEQAAVEEFE